MSVEQEVGTTAGEIFKKFHETDQYVAMSRIVKAINRDPRIVVLALGWLLREQKAEVRRDGGKMLVKIIK